MSRAVQGFRWCSGCRFQGEGLDSLGARIVGMTHFLLSHRRGLDVMHRRSIIGVVRFLWALPTFVPRKIPEVRPRHPSLHIEIQAICVRLTSPWRRSESSRGKSRTAPLASRVLVFPENSSRPKRIPSFPIHGIRAWGSGSFWLRLVDPEEASMLFQHLSLFSHGQPYLIVVATPTACPGFRTLSCIWSTHFPWSQFPENTRRR